MLAVFPAIHVADSQAFTRAISATRSPSSISSSSAPLPPPTIPPGILAYLPLTMTNTQSTPTPNPLQQMIQINSQTYSSYEATNLQNVEFFYSDGTILPSWLESGNSNSATNTIYWLSLAGGIPASTSITVYIGFASQSINLFNAQITGEAPQLSSTYGQYDDGAYVFTYYQNFAGNSCPSGWICVIHSRGSATISNGATVTGYTDGTSFASIVTADSFSPSPAKILDVFSSIHDAAGGGNIAGYTDCGTQYNPASGPPVTGCNGSDLVSWGLWDSGVANCLSTGIFPATFPSQVCGAPVHSLEGIPTVYSIWLQSSSIADFYYNYANDQHLTGFSQTNPMQLGMVSGSGTTTTTWLRMRAFPPSGIMPSVTLGSLVTSTTSVSCSPSPVAVGSAATCAATVTGNAPTGTVTWSSSGAGTFTPSYSTCILYSGSCSVLYTPSSSASSPVTITATYGGDTNNPGSSRSFSLEVVRLTTTTSVSCSPSSVSVASSSTCTATVTGNSPTGTVSWASSAVANFSPALTCTLSGGSCSVSYTPSSSTSPVTITATYGGDASNGGSSGTFNLPVASQAAPMPQSLNLLLLVLTGLIVTGAVLIIAFYLLVRHRRKSRYNPASEPSNVQP